MKYLIVVVVLAAVVAADKLAPNQPIPILRQSQDVGLDGVYNFDFETANGIAVKESGHPGLEGTVAVQGGAKWTSPEGENIEIQYTADENGYQATGPHIPTPHPIPEAIVRALEYIAAHPPKPEH